MACGVENWTLRRLNCPTAGNRGWKHGEEASWGEAGTSDWGSGRGAFARLELEKAWTESTLPTCLGSERTRLWLGA
jgi:hypothetical protein